MQVSLEASISHYNIHAYEKGSITIAIPKQHEAVPEGHRDDNHKLSKWREILTSSFVLTPEKLHRHWGSDDFNCLNEQHFADLIQYQPEIVLFGSGDKLQRPSAAILAPLINAGIGIEIMDTGAACRTFNILMADERRVVAALMII